MAAKKRASAAGAKKIARAKPKAEKKEPRRRGRPQKVPGGRTAGLNLRLHPSERAELEAGAQAFGMNVTDFLLSAAREKVARSR